MIIIYHVNLVFIFFIFAFIIFDDNIWRINWKKKKFETTITTITTTTITMKRKRLSKLRILNVYILINIALFICNNEKIFIIIIKIWNLIWRCIKSVKILIIAFIIIVFVILKSLNKYLQTVKRAKQIKNYLHFIFECDREERKKIENEIYLYDY